MISCNETNPLLADWNTPFQAPPFEQIKNEHYLPAFRAAAEKARAEIRAVADNAAPPDFENTLEALEAGGELLDRLTLLFFNLEAAETNETLQAVARDVTELTTGFSNDMYLDEKLFERIKRVRENSAELSGERKMLLDKIYRAFAANGATLSADDKAKFREISSQLALLTLTFNQNLLAATNAFVMQITDEADLKGLPQSAVDAAREEAKSRKLDGWAFTLHQPSYLPFVKYADNRTLREKLYRAFNSKAMSGDKSNLEIIEQIVNLRLRLANLLGYKSYAAYRLETTMAKNVEAVNALLDALLLASKPAVENELKALRDFARAEAGADFEIMPWDLNYYAEKLKSLKYALNDETPRPYFKLENVVDGAFKLANILYGLNFARRDDVPAYHPDVKAFEVTDDKGAFIALLYLDFFPRAGKSGGAWMTIFREQRKTGGSNQRPIVSLVCNFTEPTDAKPSLLTFGEMETFLHEFGHGLHGMLSDVTYKSLAGTNVYHDFVELPSQIMENFCVEKQFLDLFARHYETGEGIPDKLIARIVESRNFMAGYACIRQLNFGRLDMAYHTLETPLAVEVSEFERKATDETTVLPRVSETLASSSFAHIFAGEYAAGYYGYKWAEVLDADAFSVFARNGVFDKATAESFRRNILSRGGTENPMTLYLAFRGQEPSIDALLERSGLK
ncbi:MAG: M3 family metallopeptidase [Prevotellaceae bacterium]|jgi:peptidyl-dipeptidase Dcp|nr:M3 family metallopeptidase [Prevotellaceae bacterium]